MYLVFGATGSLGGQIAKKLLAAGEPVRVAVREESPARVGNPHTDPDELRDLGAEVVHADLRHPESLTAALAGVDVVVSTASGTKRMPPDTTEAVDNVGTANLARAAAGAGVRRIVLVSAAGASPEAPEGLFRDKGLGAKAVAESGVPHVIVRPGRYMGDWIGFLVGTQVQSGDVVELVGDGSKGSSFVHEPDVAEIVFHIARDAERESGEVEVATETGTYPEIVERFARATGRGLETRYVPVGSKLTTLPAPLVDVVTNLLTIHAVAPAYLNVDRSEAERYGVHLTGIDEFVTQMARPQPA